MDDSLSAPAARQLNRFCCQYLQLQPSLDYPDKENIRKDLFQQALYARLFAENAIEHAPPQRYQFRVLKELIRRIEDSIQDREEEVCLPNIYLPFYVSFGQTRTIAVASIKDINYITTMFYLPDRKLHPVLTLLCVGRLG